MKRVTVYILIVTSLFSCKQKAEIFEAKDKDLTIQAMKNDTTTGAGSMSFKARIIFNKIVAADQTYQQKTNMMYRMDSCFYLQAGRQKIYADLVQYVANGSSGIYEYMIDFEGNRLPLENFTLIYENKYVNKKRYNLKLKEN